MNRMMPTLATAAASLVISMTAQAAYSTGFDAGVGPEWTVSTTFNSGAAGVLGELADGSATLELLAPVAGNTPLSLDLLGFRTLDGPNCCTDTFQLSLNGTPVLRGTWDLGGGGGGETIFLNVFGAVVVASSPGLGQGGLAQVSIAQLPLLAGPNTLRFEYLGGLQGFGDEAWGLDNVALTGNVTAIPEPQTCALLSVGLALMAWKTKRQKRQNRS